LACEGGQDSSPSGQFTPASLPLPSLYDKPLFFYPAKRLLYRAGAESDKHLPHHHRRTPYAHCPTTRRHAACHHARVSHTTPPPGATARRTFRGLLTWLERTSNSLCNSVLRGIRGRGDPRGLDGWNCASALWRHLQRLSRIPAGISPQERRHLWPPTDL